MDERLIGGLAVSEWGDPAGPSILLWPGLGSTSAYFAVVAGSVPGRVIAVDPPGFGRSRPLDSYTFERVVELAAAVAGECQCWAMVGHSLGANLVVGVAVDPPPGLRAVVLLDGGFTDADGLAELGMPVRPSGQPAERRAHRERAWRRFAEASPLIELQVVDAWGHNALVQDPAAFNAADRDLAPKASLAPARYYQVASVEKERCGAS